MPTAVETVVRMGEHAVSGSADEVLVTIGLGSCIGLALLDRGKGLAGLAHIMLPAATAGRTDVWRFADLAVPKLHEALLARGAMKSRLEAIVVGGAQMFSFTGKDSGLDVGARNDRATREALRGLGTRIVAEATGGSKGRTLRVNVGDGHVVVREAGGETFDLLAPSMRKAA